MHRQGACSNWPKDMHFFVIQRGELVTASSKFRISKHRSRSGAYFCKDAIVERDAQELRILTPEGWKYYRWLQMLIEAKLRSLQGQWVHNELGLFQKHDALAIQGAFWQGGRNKKHQGLVHAHSGDGSVMIWGDKVSVVTHDRLVLTESGGRRKLFSKVFQRNLWDISEQ